VTDVASPAEGARKHPKAKCEACPLRTTGTFVPTKFPVRDRSGLRLDDTLHTAEGREAAAERSHRGTGVRFAVVGEAPGHQEANRGEPFIGPSGRLLNRVLEYHGIAREEVILTNATLCRPPTDSNGKNVPPPREAVQCCSTRLASDLAGVEKVLALGNTAAQVLLGTNEKITSLRIGPPRPSRLVDGLEVVSSIHPAACLRSGDMFPSLVNDAGKLQRVPPQWEPPTYVVATEVEQALSYIQQLIDRPELDELVIDIETGIDKENSYDHPNHYQMLCIGICYAKGKAVVIGEEPLLDAGVLKLLGALLRSRKLVEQNGKFDNSGLYPLFGDIRTWFDTMLASYCIDERPGNHGLKANSTEKLGAPDYERDIQKYLGTGKAKNYATIPRPILYKYNAYDVTCTWDLKEYFVPELDRLGLRELHDFLVAAANELKFLELNGITIDKEWNRELAGIYLERLAELEEKMDACLPEGAVYDKKGGINPRSPKQLKEYFSDQEIKLPDTTADTITALKDRLKPGPVLDFVELLLQHRLKAKRYGTYIKGIISRTYRGRVYTTYSLHGTTSGRLASRNPNLQNIVRDKEIKRQFTVSKPGNIFVAADQKQAEGRVICTLAQEPYLRDIFSDTSRDLFDEMGRDLYGKDVFTKDERVRIKAYFYGLGYGREAYSIAAEYGMSVREAEEGLRAFMDLIPNVKAWQQRTRQLILDGEDLVTSFGRRRRFWLITRENQKDVLNEGLSYMPQSIASDITLAALTRLRPMLRGLAFLRLTIHDALVAECAEERREEVGHLLSTVMVEEGAKWTDYVPFAVDLSYGKNWGELS
jgi:DNA polymerase I